MAGIVVVARTAIPLIIAPLRTQQEATASESEPNWITAHPVLRGPLHITFVFDLR